MKENGDAGPGVNRRALFRAVILRYIGAFLFLGAALFIPAGTLAYWQAWVYLAVLMLLVGFVGAYLFIRDPKLLERRMRMRETQSTQKKVVAVTWIFFLAAFVIPGLDIRFGWSNVPYPVVIAADVIVLLGYFIVFLVFRENSYASRVVEVEKGQKVISTGPYAVVRHPMYSGVIVFYVFSPLALGSYWGMIPALFIIPALAARIKGEERELSAELEGYKEYTARVRYRLVPGIW